MDNGNLQEIEDNGLKDAVRTYFKGLTGGYSEKTIETYRRVLTARYGITDFEKLKQNFRDGTFD